MDQWAECPLKSRPQKGNIRFRADGLSTGISNEVLIRIQLNFGRGTGTGSMRRAPQRDPALSSEPRH